MTTRCRNRSGQFARCATGRRAAGPTYVKHYGVKGPATVTSKWAEFEPGDDVFVGYRGHGSVLGKEPATKRDPAAVHIAWKDGTESWAQVGSALLERDLVKLSYFGQPPQGQGARKKVGPVPGPRLYLSVTSNPAQQSQSRGSDRSWGVIHDGGPMMATTYDPAAALSVYRKLDRATDSDAIPVWDGDLGRFVTLYDAMHPSRGGAARKFPKGGPCASYKTTPAREKCRARVGAKIGKLLDEGISQQQAVATALSMESAGRLGPRGGYQKVGRGRRAEAWTVEAYIFGNFTKPVRSWGGFRSKADADAFAKRQREVAREAGYTHRIEVRRA